MADDKLTRLAERCEEAAIQMAEGYFARLADYDDDAVPVALSGRGYEMEALDQAEKLARLAAAFRELSR